MNPVLTSPWLLIAAVALLVLGSARFTRLITADSFPFSVRLRIWWEDHVKEPWQPLMTCPWCFAPYVVALNMFLAWATDMHPAWWIINGWLAAAYAASWVVFHDEDGS